MRLQHTSLLPCSFDRCREEVTRPALLEHVSAPMLAYELLDPPAFGPHWEERAYRVALRLGGRLPIGQHTLAMDVTTDEPGHFEIVDHGFSDLIAVWEHRLSISEFHGMTRYRDDVQVRAGVLTPVVWLFAWCFYAHRQRRLRALVATDFAATRA